MSGSVPIAPGSDERTNGGHEKHAAGQEEHNGTLNGSLGEVETPHFDWHVGTDHPYQRSDHTEVHRMFVKRRLERGDQPCEQESTTNPRGNERRFGNHTRHGVGSALSVAVKSDEDAENGSKECEISHGICW